MNKLCRDNVTQLVEACLCPINRYSTMVEHSCNELDLFYHPEWLFKHYIENGGAKRNAELRRENERS